VPAHCRDHEKAEWIYRYARQARLVDGASEVHRGVLAAFLLDERNAF
jgi:acyl-CoA dehydrogenase